MTHFYRAPTVFRHPVTGLCVEGVIQDGAIDEVRDFELAIASYGHLVPLNTTMTGGQWISAIKRQYDSSEPRNAAVIDSIKRVMLVEQFEDDCLLLDPRGQAVFRGAKVDCDWREAKLKNGRGAMPGAWSQVYVAEATPDQVVLAEFNKARYLLQEKYPNDSAVAHYSDAQHLADLERAGLTFGTTYLPFPPAYAITVYPSEGVDRHMLVREHRLLKARPVGEQTFSAAEHQDRQAGLELMANLVRYQGYQSLVSYGSKPRGVSAGGRPGRGALTPRQIENSLLLFVDSLLDADGWDPKTPVFIVRPAPIVNPFASIRPYESLVHEKIIGWRLPQGLVEIFAEEARELREEQAQVRKHGERAV